jgi:SAM-dependent methyltransferase
LVDAGYTVIHRDLVAAHVEQVRSRHAHLVDTAVGDARALDLPDDSVDAVLLLGPLYHLEDPADRVRALREAGRVVRSRGVVYVAAISRWAARLHGMLVERVHLKYPTIVEMVDEMEATGDMRPIHDNSFNGYAHTPDQLRDEVQLSGLELESFVALEGISFALSDLDQRLDDPDERRLLLDTLRAHDHVAELLGLGPHLLATARKP